MCKLARSSHIQVGYLRSFVLLCKIWVNSKDRVDTITKRNWFMQVRRHCRSLYLHHSSGAFVFGRLMLLVEEVIMLTICLMLLFLSLIYEKKKLNFKDENAVRCLSLTNSPLRFTEFLLQMKNNFCNQWSLKNQTN